MNYLFVYGSLKKGKYNHQRYDFHKSIFVGPGVVVGYSLVKDDQLPYPYCIADAQGMVIGEVYAVAPECLERLDHMEIGAGYKRIEVEIKGSKVFMYVEGNGQTFPDLKRFKEF